MRGGQEAPCLSGGWVSHTQATGRGCRGTARPHAGEQPGLTPRSQQDLVLAPGDPDASSPMPSRGPCPHSLPPCTTSPRSKPYQIWEDTAITGPRLPCLEPRGTGPPAPHPTQAGRRMSPTRSCGKKLLAPRDAYSTLFASLQKSRR